MRDRKPLRGALVLSNLLLLLAPHVVRADNGVERQPDPEPAVQPAPTSHHAPGKVRPQPASPSPSPRSRPQSRPADDDDDAGEVAGEVAGACCAGMIGAMAEPSTPEDVELPEMPPPVDPPQPAGAGGAPPAVGPSPPAGPFDRRAAEAALGAAEARARERCGPPEHEEVLVRVTFDGSGDPIDVLFTPKGLTNTDHGRCVEGEVLAARVPAFEGQPTEVVRTFTLR